MNAVLIAAIGIIGGAYITSLIVDERSPILHDRLIVAGIGAFIGLISVAVIACGWHLALMTFAMLDGINPATMPSQSIPAECTLSGGSHATD
ncbi:hypothetical protein [Vreelandella venusta]|uniref:Uncharacterized protein n=1 Tax=Vreelandella venusta TaxID=44935 RepID=A0ABX2BBC8_9GAMM|nr:hypothetical protein [Halomonas venusta]AZM96102.1 hypothetical protein EI420_10585 [Halomonas venusta]NPT30606.1 hypothetical protein [Halomonas venusta]